MRHFIFLVGIVCLLSSVILLTSALPLEKIPVAATSAIHNKIKIPVNKFAAEQSIATEWKGSKLTLKERIALKVFGKKIKNKTGNNLPSETSGKSQLVAVVICLLPILIMIFGFHRFYLGYTWQGVAQLITMGGCGVWWLIDLIRIISGDLKPRIGDYDRRK